MDKLDLPRDVAAALLRRDRETVKHLFATAIMRSSDSYIEPQKVEEMADEVAGWLFEDE